MKRTPRKLELSRETLSALEDRVLRRVGGASDYPCTDACDTDYQCSSGCEQVTNIWYACG